MKLGSRIGVTQTQLDLHPAMSEFMLDAFWLTGEGAFPWRVVRLPTQTITVGLRPTVYAELDHSCVNQILKNGPVSVRCGAMGEHFRVDAATGPMPVDE